MDYLHYRLKNWKPFEYIGMSEAKKRVARQYMKIEIEERNKSNENLERALGGEG